MTSARQRIHAQYASGKHKTATRALRERKIFDTYGRASCRYMCQKILVSLPPELCDMIIEHVIGHSRTGVAAGGTCEPVYAYDQYHPPAHYWKVEYVGKAMLARMMAVWYRANTFNVRWHLVDLRRFLDENAPSIHTSRYKLITKICIVVSPDFLAFDPKKDRPGNILFRMYSPRSWEEQIRDLELLFQLRTGASILIHLDYMDTSAMPDDAQNTLLLEGTAPMIECLCRLRKAGYVVGASIAGFGDYRGLVDEFQYRLEEMDALEQETNCMPVNVTGMAWR